MISGNAVKHVTNLMNIIVSSWKRNPSICAAAQQPRTPLNEHCYVTRY